jgi:hypothetical protein
MKNGGIRTTTDNESAGWYENLRGGRGKGLGWLPALPHCLIAFST